MAEHWSEVGMNKKPNRCRCGGLRHKHDMERIAELEKVAEAAEANNVKRILIKYADFHPQWKALADALRAAGYLGGGDGV